MSSKDPMDMERDPLDPAGLPPEEDTPAPPDSSGGRRRPEGDNRLVGE